MKEINGVRGKVILDIRDPEGKHYSLPTYSNTSDMYFKVDKDGIVIQGRLYINRNTVLDFDWGHKHRNPSGEVFQKGTIHVQEYGVDSNGHKTRYSESARRPTATEIKKYAPIIKAFNKNVIF